MRKAVQGLTSTPRTASPCGGPPRHQGVLIALRIPDPELTEARWFASSYSSDQGGIVFEVADLTSTSCTCVAVHDFKAPDGTGVLIGPSVFGALLASSCEAVPGLSGLDLPRQGTFLVAEFEVER
ncbi:DUF397 domain-containing protein [Streptomyces phaeochromogenes]